MYQYYSILFSGYEHFSVIAIIANFFVFFNCEKDIGFYILKKIAIYIARAYIFWGNRCYLAHFLHFDNQRKTKNYFGNFLLSIKSTNPYFPLYIKIFTNTNGPLI